MIDELEEVALAPLPLRRFVREQAHIAPVAIPTALTFEERVTQRCLALCELLGWEIGVSMSLLDAVLEAGTPDHVLVRVVEAHEEAHSLRVLHTAWELRRLWYAEGPLTGWMTWHHAVVLVACWHHDAPEADELAHWLDEAFRSWHRARPYTSWWIFHEELVDWLDEDGPDALLYAEFPWDDQLPSDHTPTPRW